MKVLMNNKLELYNNNIILMMVAMIILIMIYEMYFLVWNLFY